MKLVIIAENEDRYERQARRMKVRLLGKIYEAIEEGAFLKDKYLEPSIDEVFPWFEENPDDLSISFIIDVPSLLNNRSINEFGRMIAIPTSAYVKASLEDVDDKLTVKASISVKNSPTIYIRFDTIPMFLKFLPTVVYMQPAIPAVLRPDTYLVKIYRDSIAKLDERHEDLKTEIQEYQINPTLQLARPHFLSNSMRDVETWPTRRSNYLNKMEKAIDKAKSCKVGDDLNNWGVIQDHLFWPGQVFIGGRIGFHVIPKGVTVVGIN